MKKKKLMLSPEKDPKVVKEKSVPIKDLDLQGLKALAWDVETQIKTYQGVLTQVSALIDKKVKGNGDGSVQKNSS